jgi:four helix bundle protein
MRERTSLSRFGAYGKALELFDGAVADARLLNRIPGLERLVSQLLAGAESIAANIEEGYGRGSPRDYAHFLVIARGSAQETAGRYLRLRPWLPAGIPDQRAALCGEIIGILTTSIATLRLRSLSSRPS